MVTTNEIAPDSHPPCQCDHFCPVHSHQVPEIWTIIRATYEGLNLALDLQHQSLKLLSELQWLLDDSAYALWNDSDLPTQLAQHELSELGRRTESKIASGSDLPSRYFSEALQRFIAPCPRNENVAHPPEAVNESEKDEPGHDHDSQYPQ